MKIYNKYIVKKANGETDPNAEYFVLRIDKDSAARKALRTYASQMWIQGEKEFADSLTEWANKHSFKKLEKEGKL